MDHHPLAEFVQRLAVRRRPIRRRETARGAVKTRQLVGDVDPKITVEALKPYQKIESLALVGHNPHLEGLLALLIAGSDRGANISLKKGGVARLDAELSDTRIKAALTWLATPKLLRGS